MADSFLTFTRRKLSERAWSTIQGFEGIRMLNKGQFDFWLRRDEPKLRVQESRHLSYDIMNTAI
ncbi:hypothetical protein BS333_03460 [Vibrio azureus]|nr:hypothetical protein BS333_03460 [Vibrio azureus]